MTENKRFNSLWEYESGTGDIAIYNDEKQYWIIEKGYPQSKAIHDVVDLLNEQHEKIEFVSLLANHRGEMIAFANSLIQDLDDETEKEMWETFKEEMWQKWKKQRGIK